MFTPDLEELQRLVHDLDADLDLWDDRPEGPSARCRRAANEAMDGIDKALAELHRIRAKLLSEIRADDAATLARTDALLARSRAILGEADGSPNPLIAHPPVGGRGAYDPSHPAAVPRQGGPEPSA